MNLFSTSVCDIITLLCLSWLSSGAVTDRGGDDRLVVHQRFHVCASLIVTNLESGTVSRFSSHLAADCIRFL